MDKFLGLVEGNSTEISKAEEMDEEMLKKLLKKSAVWVHYNMTREEYITTSENEQQILIIKYYDEMLKGKNL